MLKNLLLASATVAGALGMFGSAQAAVIYVIDDFTIGLNNGACVAPCEIVANSLTTDVDPIAPGTQTFDRSTDGSGLHIIGGDREVTLTWNSGAGSASASVTPEGVYQHSNDNNVDGDSLLRWDGNNANDDDGLNFDGGLNLDLSAGNLYVHLQVLTADLGGGSASLTLYSAGGSATQSVGLAVGDWYIPLTLFDVGSLDLMNITAIELFIDGLGSLDASIDIVEVVPEPMTLGLFGLGLLGAGLARRRIAA